MTVVHEWRVTGQPNSAHGVDYPPYLYVWRDTEGNRALTAEQAARRFAQAMEGWTDGPHVHHRTVTYTEWEPS